MNTSRSRLIVLFNLCMIAMTLTSCAGSPTPAPGGRVVIRLLVDDYGPRPEPPWVAAFNASQDDIQLELMYFVFEATTLQTQLMSYAEDRRGNLPDLIGPYPPDMLHSITNQWLDLRPYLDSEDLEGFDPNALRGWQDEDGRLLGLPFNVYPSVIFYNRALFDAAGIPYPPARLGEPYADGEAWTIEKMEEIAIQLTLDGQGRTPASPDFDPADVRQYGLAHKANCMAEVTALLGDLQPAIAAEEKITWTEPGKDAIRWYYSGMWEKHFIAPAGKVDLWTALDSGGTAMVYMPSWYAVAIKTLQTWDIAAVPSHNGQIVSYSDINGMAVLSTTRHPQEAAKALLQLASMPEVSVYENIEAGIALPARMDFQPAYLAMLDARYPQGVNWQVVVDSLPYSQYPDYHYLRRALCQRDFMNRLVNRPDLDLEAEFKGIAYYYFVPSAENPVPQGSVMISSAYILAPAFTYMPHGPDIVEDLRTALEAVLNDSRNGWISDQLNIVEITFDDGHADVVLEGEYFGVGDVTLMAAGMQILMTVFANPSVQTATVTLNGDTIGNLGISNSIHARPANYVFTRAEIETFMIEHRYVSP
jgi:multiple sugar transport system substrate-binding protein